MAFVLRVASMIAAMALAASPVMAASDPERAAAEQRLREAERSLSEAEAARQAISAETAALQAEVASLRAAVSVAAEDLRSHERQIRQRAAELARVKQKQAEYMEKWQVRRAEIGQSVSALTRLAVVPPAATLIQDTDTTGRLRSAFVLRGLIPRLHERAGLLRQDLAHIRETAGNVEAAQAALVAARRDLEDRLAETEKLAVRKNATLAVRQNEAAMAAALANRQAKSADNIRELIARLDDARSARNAAIKAERRRRAAIAARAGTNVPRDPGPPLQLAGLERRQGGLRLPVTGSLASRFGEGDAAFAEGITILAVAGAPVLAPADGRIRYAGEFQNYGLVLIVDHGGGFHSVLTGFARVNVVTDQWVLAGEPLGRLASDGSLYIEIRRDGLPMDPLNWFMGGRS